MNLRIHLSRSNRYRKLGMFDESIFELEEIEGEDRWHSLQSWKHATTPTTMQKSGTGEDRGGL